MTRSSAKWRIDYTSKKSVVRVRAVGKITADTLEVIICEAVAFAATQGSSSFLLDIRHATCAISTVGIYNLPQAISFIGLSRARRVAILASPSAPNVHDAEFYEIRAGNTGFAHRLFSDAEAALAWLAPTPCESQSASSPRTRVAPKRAAAPSAAARGIRRVANSA
jgi:hypothetical protein